MRMPLERKAASRPMLDMVVATTRSPASSALACMSRAATSITPSPFTTRPWASAKSARSASPSKVIPRSAPSDFVSWATVSGCRAPQLSLMLRPLGVACVR